MGEASCGCGHRRDTRIRRDGREGGRHLLYREADGPKSSGSRNGWPLDSFFICLNEARGQFLMKSFRWLRQRRYGRGNNIHHHWDSYREADDADVDTQRPRGPNKTACSY